MTTKTKTPKLRDLLPCPDCHSQEYLVMFTVHSNGKAVVVCTSSKCLPKWRRSKNREAAIKAWNKRAKPQHKEPSK